MIVDIGAGTTDVAMFAKGHVDGIVTMRHVKESKGSLPWAGKAIDRALIDHMVGRSSKSRLRADLQREGMGEPIKEDIFRDHVVTRFGMSTSLDEFLQSEGMSRVQAEIRRGFEDVLLRVDRSFFGRTVAVRFSGGGHELPFLKDLVKAERYLGDRLVRMGTANKRPRWQDHSEFVGLSREVGNKSATSAKGAGLPAGCAARDGGFVADRAHSPALPDCRGRRCRSPKSQGRGASAPPACRGQEVSKGTSSVRWPKAIAS